jgi:hypothetical protein
VKVRKKINYNASRLRLLELDASGRNMTDFTPSLHRLRPEQSRQFGDEPHKMELAGSSYIAPPM